MTALAVGILVATYLALFWLWPASQVWLRGTHEWSEYFFLVFLLHVCVAGCFPVIVAIGWAGYHLGALR